MDNCYICYALDFCMGGPSGRGVAKCMRVGGDQSLGHACSFVMLGLCVIECVHENESAMYEREPDI